MSSPAADIAPPLAALVLAWDETTPAVRALIEATQAPGPALDSILVMVPRAEDPAALSAEEYLPLPPLPPKDEAEPAPPAAEAERPAPSSSPSVSSEPAPLLPLPRLAASLPPPPSSPPWAAVRVLRLSGQTLPELARRAGRPLPAPNWTGAAGSPAAPYQGAASLPPEPMKVTRPAKRTAAPAIATLPPLPPYEPAAPLPLAPEAEAGWLRGAEELKRFELSLAEPAPELPTLPAPAEPEGWPAALAALRQPAALPTAEAPAPTPPAEPEVLESPLISTLYNAPNLNFQVIQYARFAVPVALAEAPYAVIYAPAWPTWLAAQELRRRTGQPLVLHVDALAAPADEPLDLAAGWIAELQRQALRRADVILTETSALAQRLCHELGLPSTRVHTVPAAHTEALALALHAARTRPAAGPA